MTGRTTRIAAVGAGALLGLGIMTAAPAGASDGVQTDATVQAGTADAVGQTVDLLNQACLDATNVSGTAVSTLASGHAITVASSQGGTGLNLAVSLPKLTDALPLLGSLPVVGSASGQVEAAPLKISCAVSGDGTGIGLSAAGVDALVSAIAPGLDVSSVLADAGLAASTNAGAVTGTADTSATAGAPAGQAAVTAQSPAVRAAAAAKPRTAAATATTTASAAPAPSSASGGIVAQTIGSPGALARTGAGVSFLGLLGTALIGSGRLLAFGRRLLRIG